MGFEPTRAEHIGLAVQRLNHSATSSLMWWENTFMNNWNLLQRNKFWNSEFPLDYVTEIPEENTGKRPGIIFFTFSYCGLSRKTCKAFRPSSVEEPFVLDCYQLSWLIGHRKGIDKLTFGCTGMRSSRRPVYRTGALVLRCGELWITSEVKRQDFPFKHLITIEGHVKRADIYLKL